MSGETKSIYSLTRRDIPRKEPCFKEKRGLLYRFNGCGYTDDPTEAQMYPREEAIRYCFGQGRKNGDRWGRDTRVYAVPVRLYLKNNGLSKSKILKKIEVLKGLLPYAEDV